MGRNIGRHTDSDSGRSVYQKIWISGRKYGRLFFRLVEVRHKIHCVFADIRQHLHGNLTEPCLCITHSGSSVSIHRTKITVSVYKRITGGPFLSHIDKGSVNGTVSVRMIFTHGIADNTRTFSVGFIRSVI